MIELGLSVVQAITERSRSTGAAQNMFLGSPTAAVTQSAKSLNQFSVGSQMQSNTVKVLGGGTVQVTIPSHWIERIISFIAAQYLMQRDKTRNQADIYNGRYHARHGNAGQGDWSIRRASPRTATRRLLCVGVI